MKLLKGWFNHLVTPRHVKVAPSGVMLSHNYEGKLLTHKRGIYRKEGDMWIDHDTGLTKFEMEKLQGES